MVVLGCRSLVLVIIIIIIIIIVSYTIGEMLQKHCFAENLQNLAPSQKQIASYKCNYNTWMHSFMLL